MTEEMIKILQDLIDSEPIADIEIVPAGTPVTCCACCLNELPDYGEERTMDLHTKECPYRRAYELLERTGNL